VDIKLQRAEIVDLLLGTERGGIDKLIDFMDKQGFFTSPASTVFHGCYDGGLAHHSLQVDFNLRYLNNELDLGLKDETIKITCLLHDLCKAGSYIGSDGKYSWNSGQPKGHSVLSLKWIEQFIELTTLEREMIRFHMGPYATVGKWAEYTLQDWIQACNSAREVKVIYFADELAAVKWRKK